MTAVARLTCVFRFLDKKSKIMRLWTADGVVYYATRGHYAISRFCTSIEEAVEQTV
jgi:hypothetical protein